jgi:hypothetical protein
MAFRRNPITPKSNRQGVPSGYVVGRISKGTGSEELIPLSTLSSALAKSGPSNATTSGDTREFLSFFGTGLFGANQYFVIPGPAYKAHFPPTGADKSVAKAKYAGKNNTHFYLTDDYASFLANGSHLFCTVLFTAGSLTGTFTYNGTIIVQPGQEMYVVCDPVADPSLAEVTILFNGDLQP